MVANRSAPVRLPAHSTTVNPPSTRLWTWPANLAPSPRMGSQPRLSMAGTSGPSAVGTSESMAASLSARRRSKGTCSRGAPAPSSRPHVEARASASADSSSASSSARWRTRLGSTTMTTALSGSRSVMISSDDESHGSHDSMPSNSDPSDNCSHWWRPHGAVPTSVAAARRTSSSGSNSRQPNSDTVSTAAVDRWSATSKRVRRSTSSPHRSIRTGSSSVEGKTSTMPPRTASSPRCSTRDSRR